MDLGVTRQTDSVILRRIPFNINIGPDAWGRDKPQPIILSLEVPYDLQRAAANDDVSHTLDYGKLYKALSMRLVGQTWSIVDFVLCLRNVLHPVELFLAEIVLPKGNLRAGGGLHFKFDFRAGENPKAIILIQTLTIRGIHCACIVGVNSHEREEKQIVVVNLDFERTDNIDEDQENLQHLLSPDLKETMPGVPYAEVIRKVVKQVEGSTYQTIEALATAIAKTVTVTFDVPGVWVEIEKPNAIAAIEAAGVRMYREKSFFTEDKFWQIRRP